MKNLDWQNEAIWAAIDDIAAARGISTSRLAIITGHDSTSFNKSKRSRGKAKRWPSFEVIARVLDTVGMTYAEFGAMVDQRAGRAPQT